MNLEMYLLLYSSPNFWINCFGFHKMWENTVILTIRFFLTHLLELISGEILHLNILSYQIATLPLTLLHSHQWWYHGEKRRSGQLVWCVAQYFIRRKLLYQPTPNPQPGKQNTMDSCPCKVFIWSAIEGALSFWTRFWLCYLLTWKKN